MIGMRMEHADQTQSQLLRGHFGFEIIRGRDQVAVVPRRVFAGVGQWQDALHLSFRAQEKPRAFLGIRALAVRVDLVERFLRNDQRHFPSHSALSLKYL